jgi:hypothetical protein
MADHNPLYLEPGTAPAAVLRTAPPSESCQVMRTESAPSNTVVLVVEDGRAPARAASFADVRSQVAASRIARMWRSYRSRRSLVGQPVVSSDVFDVSSARRPHFPSRSRQVQFELFTQIPTVTNKQASARTGWLADMWPACKALHIRDK